MKWFRNLKENKEYYNKVVREAKEQERKEVETHYLVKVASMRKEHDKATDDLKYRFEERVRILELNLQKEHIVKMQQIDAIHKQELEALNTKINNLKHEQKVLSEAWEESDRDLYTKFELEKFQLSQKNEADIEDMKTKFANEVRALRGRIDDCNDKLRSAQKGYFRYLKYALLSFQFIKELKAESEIWMMQGAEYHQRMEKMNAKFQSISRFNERTEPLIKNLLHYNKETDEELVEEVMRDFPDMDEAEKEIEKEISEALGEHK